eukprot:symbB.v1.2.012338.t1/scaffold826.1/size159518/5
MGIIDILTPYDEMKKFEHRFKACVILLWLCVMIGMVFHAALLRSMQVAFAASWRRPLPRRSALKLPVRRAHQPLQWEGPKSPEPTISQPSQEFPTHSDAGEAAVSYTYTWAVDEEHTLRHSLFDSAGEDLPV